MTDLRPIAEDWSTALAVVAHPDDMEYGAASAVARWTSQGKRVAYLLVTRGEAGIDSMEPESVAALREAEQRRSCAVVGVDTLEYLDHPDGLVEPTIALRRDIAVAIRRHRPDVLITVNHHDSWGGASWNHADHRAVGRAVLDAARDAGNRWVFRDGGAPWNGVRFVAVSSSPHSSHAVDVTATLDLGIASLACHTTYLAALGDHVEPDRMLRTAARSTGERFGCEYATAFEVVEP